MSRPTVHVSVADPETRTRIVDALHRQGWAITCQPTGFHLLQAIADVIDGREAPVLVVVDAIARGCSGISIAAGLRDLGVRIPLVLVARPGEPITVFDDPSIRVVGPSHAVAEVAAVARPLIGDALVDNDCNPTQLEIEHGENHDTQVA